MAGPEDSPFQGGTFELSFVFENYPFKAPKIVFNTKIYHPNISDAGEICHEVYEADWVPTKKVRSIMDILRSMLISPNPASPIREDIAQQFAEDHANYVKTA
jgi:ubiquitin-conjugating enzyme E2 D/E